MAVDPVADTPERAALRATVRRIVDTAWSTARSPWSRAARSCGGRWRSRRPGAMQRYFRDARLWSFSPLTNEMVCNRIGEQHPGLPRSHRETA